MAPKRKGQVVCDDEQPGFGFRVYASGKRSYLIQYRAKGRSRRCTIGLQGVWTPETAHREAKTLPGQIARGEDPAAEREEERRAVTVGELCEQ
ncbi:Arm DNA-binding domain-containing protein [uncultured Roseobacter sp.]|uniref:Arm DNA-binding domain-containing protein n=1 Tax=uncultured Roseobacter sp. TaxID=114847 RepID=UPI0034226845